MPGCIYAKLLFMLNGNILVSGIFHIVYMVITSDPETLEEIEQWRQPLERLLTEPVGETFVFLNGTREECRARECNMGKMSFNHHDYCKKTQV